MGSEHYCLRWNNHQSNLLGVFSQLLQDESLVDVTLSCSEGAPIRAHKVVLSACSSYFQSLFLDHPERHPIVILKDVRFAELQTLVEFMYKGEVNVQYCQLSALLKTAESLKVKGLAEMTNQNTTLREPEREPDRLRSHSQPGKKTCESPVDAALTGSAASSSLSASASSSTSASSIAAASAAVASATSTSSASAATVAAASAAASPTSSSISGIAAGSTHPSATASTTNTTTTSSGAATAASERSSSSSNAVSALTTATTTSAATLKRDASERCSPSPPKRLLATTSHSLSSPIPLDLYQRRSEHTAAADGSEASRSHATDNTASTSNNQAKRCKTPATAADLSTSTATTSNNNGDERDFHSPERMERPPSISLHRGGGGGGGSGSGAGDIEEIEDVDDDYDEDMDDDDDADNSSNEMGLNLKNIAAMVAANAAAAAAGHRSSAGTPLVMQHSPLSAGGAGDVESARSTPAGVAASATSTALPADLTQRPASRSSRDGGGGSAHCSLDRPSSRGGGGGGGDGGSRYGLPSTHGGDMSPNSLAAVAAAGVGGDSSGLGPVQSVPLSLKKEIDCSEDDNSSSRHMLLQPRSASASGGLGGGGGGVAELDYRASHESMLHNFGHSMVGMGAAGIPPASIAARCAAPPFAFPFTPLGLNLFDIDPSRILSMLHHQTWLAEEALRTRGLLTAPKESPHRFATLSDLLTKEYQALPHSPHLTAGDLHATAAITAKQQQQQQTQRSNSQQQMYKHQQQQHQHQQQQPFNIRYPSPAATAAAAFFHHQQHQHQQQQLLHHQQQQNEQQKAKQSRQVQTPSPLQTATSTQPSWSPKDPLLEELKRKSEETVQREECEAEGSNINSNELLSSTHDENGAGVTACGSNSNTPTSSSLYKDSLEQLLQRRRSSSSLGEGMRSASSYSQLMLSASCSNIETSSCKEKSSSSSTSSTPPLSLASKSANSTATTAALLAQHQHQQQQQLNHMLKSPSAESSSSLFSEPIEEETRCVVCNAHFPNVWLLEQHAALQHPHLGPGDEKPFICEQCGQSYRYRSAYAKHKEQNHRARLPADKLFTCDVCGMQFRYLKSFKKHRLNHALERLHGKKIGPTGLGAARMHMTGLGGGHMEQDVVTSSQEPNLPAADESGEDLRINIKREPFDEEREEEQDNTIDSVGGGIGSASGGGVSSGSSSLLLFNDNNSTASTSTEPNISSSDVIHSTNKRPRLLTTPHMETDPSYHHHHLQHHHPHLAPSHVHVAAPSSLHPSHQQPTASTAAAAAAALNSLHSINSITSLINAERIPSEQFLGLNPQEASILNFLRVDAAERQRDKRGPQTSRFACPFCGKCVRSKENLKLHVRKHTGERPFVCLFCGRAFGGKSDLTRHLRIHTGERPYHCESCGKCFARADYLSKHLTTHIHNAPR